MELILRYGLYCCVSIVFFYKQNNGVFKEGERVDQMGKEEGEEDWGQDFVVDWEVLLGNFKLNFF